VGTGLLCPASTITNKALGVVLLVTEPSHAVFLSYASEDAAAAQRIATALRAAGIDVWLDTSELRGGDVWDRQIRNQIHDCALFVPVISAHSDARHEGYFRWDCGPQSKLMHVATIMSRLETESDRR
jgi:hypothetical protein